MRFLKYLTGDDVSIYNYDAMVFITGYPLVEALLYEAILDNKEHLLKYLGKPGCYEFEYEGRKYQTEITYSNKIPEFGFKYLDKNGKLEHKPLSVTGQDLKKPTLDFYSIVLTAFKMYLEKENPERINLDIQNANLFSPYSTIFHSMRKRGAPYNLYDIENADLFHQLTNIARKNKKEKIKAIGIGLTLNLKRKDKVTIYGHQ
jgi:hypothetical protein